MISGEDFRKQASAVFGNHWLTRSSVHFSVHTSTIRRWAEGENPVPERVEETLRYMVVIKHRELSQLLAQMGTV